MSDKKDEALNLALEAIEAFLSAGTEAEEQDASDKLCEARAAIRKAQQRPQNCGTGYCSCIECPYEQPAQQQEPVACIYEGHLYMAHEFQSGQCPIGSKMLYTSPQPAQQQEPHVPVTDNTYGYAKSLAEAIFKQHFASDEHYASGRIVWGVNDTVIGILTQIDNMVADMVRRPAQQQEPVAWLHPANATCVTTDSTAYARGIPLYAAPPKREWRGLTDAEFQWIYDNGRTPAGMMELTEAKLREKNT